MLSLQKKNILNVGERLFRNIYFVNIYKRRDKKSEKDIIRKSFNGPKCYVLGSFDTYESLEDMKYCTCSHSYSL
jgi:hypothetical protein